MQVLIGSISEGEIIPTVIFLLFFVHLSLPQVNTCFLGRFSQANVLISFNNKPASEAVPYFDQVHGI